MEFCHLMQAGNVFCLGRPRLGIWKFPTWASLNTTFLQKRCPQIEPRTIIQGRSGAVICSSESPLVLHDNAKLSYSLAAAAGRNQFRGSNVIELQCYKPASVDDTMSVHSKSYVAGLEKELAAAKKAASLAARLCQKVQKALLQSDVQSKLDRSPVTVADYGSQAIVSFVLEKELPSEPFSMVAEEDSGDLRKESGQETLQRITELVNETLSSEGSYSASTLKAEDVLREIDNGKSEGGPTGRHWVLDPIDGTKGFLRGDQYAIALALLDDGKVVLGVLACPNLPLEPISSNNQHSSLGDVGCLFFSTVGAGTYMQSLTGSTLTKVSVSATENPEEASFFESYEAAHSLHDLTSSIAQKLGVKAPPVRIDSQAKYGALSRGDGAIYLRFPHKGYREKIWDHAAGCIVVTEAGGVVTDAAGNALDFSRGRYLDLHEGIIVTNQRLMPSLLNAVQEALQQSASSAL